MRFVLGFAAGLVLLRLRAPEGLDLFELPAAHPWSSALVRAQGLLAAALTVALLKRRVLDGRPGADLLLGLATGALVGLVAAPVPAPAWAAPGGPLVQGALAAALALATLGALVWRERQAEELGGEGRSGPLLISATLCGGAGAALAAEPLVRHSLRLGLGTGGDACAVAFAALLGMVLGGLAFGRLLAGLAGDRARGAATPLALALAGPLALVSLRSTAHVASPRGLRTFAQRFGMDVSDSGTLLFDVLVALPSLLPLTFAVGLALYAARERRLLVAGLVGAAAGTALVPLRLEALGVRDLLAGEAGSAVLAADGAWLGALAAGLVCCAARRRAVALLTVGLAVAAAATLPTPPLPTLRAWRRFPAAPVLALECAAGQLLVEPDGADGLRVTLDQRVLAPGTRGVTSERARFEASFALLPDEVRARGARVLLVGQLDPPRAAVLSGLGARQVDATGSWAEAMGVLEERLFARSALPRPPGHPLPVRGARAQLAEGAYDLVLVPAVAGAAPRAPAAVAGDTPAVAWVDGGAPIAWGSLPTEVLVTSNGLDDLALGWVWNALADDPWPTGRPARPPWLGAWLGQREWERASPSRAELCRRLARATDVAPRSALLEALADHYDLQVHSSPYESEAQQVELEAGTLERMVAAALRGPRDAFAEGVVWGIADVLVGKRAVEALYELVEPASVAWGRPSWLELALARADREALDPGSAVRRLTPLAERSPDDTALARALADALDAAGQPAEAARAWARVQWLDPGSREPRRRRALALLRAGDPAGANLAGELLQEDPEDAELRAALESGPAPPAPPGYVPPGGRHDHDEDG